MELIIKIDDEMVCNDIKNKALEPTSETDKVIINALYNGTPLPKGHGRLIDADTYRKDMMHSQEFNFFKILDMQSTVVEADDEADEESNDGSDNKDS